MSEDFDNEDADYVPSQIYEFDQLTPDIRAIFDNVLKSNPVYKEKLIWYFSKDFELIRSVQFYK